MGEALPARLRGHGPQVPPVVPQLVRLPLQGQARRREVAQSGKGAPPFVHGRREFPQLEEAR